jgi:glycosyltransferase involved in cell wall biosynthesis
MQTLRPVLVGLHLTTASVRLRETLAALYEATPQSFALVLLQDPAPGEEDGLAATLDALDCVLRLAVPAPGGAPAALNCLLAQPARVHVLLEDGARPAWGWLGHLLAALDADASHGLAGPATDRCWNLQSQAEPGTGVQRLAPLQGPADFCLAVRSELVDAIGGADPAYGRGPCWELDYSVRAARAGFHGVWARAARVLRGPLPAWRLASEPALMQASRQRLEGAGQREPVALTAPAALHVPAARVPLVSCIMPTRGRPAFVARAIGYFRRQDYPARELVIVHESDDDLPAGLAGELGGPDIRVVRTGERSIGAKRNAAVRAARGEIIAHWDDDDWYGVQRLSRQVLPIRQGVADMTGLNDMLFMVTRGLEFWGVTRALFARLFLENVSGGTLVFRRALWERFGPYPATSLREDADFMAAALRGGARLCRLPGQDLCVYVRHARNTWKFAEGRYLQQGGWQRVAAPEFIAQDLDFYRTAQPPAHAPTPAVAAPAVLRAARPLVSCIMPTAQRRAFVPRAIQQFLAQDYPTRELVVVDDGEDSIADLVPDAPGVRYLRLGARTSLGEKRNIACEAARGELVAHWDDDDWMAPRWLGAQVDTLLAHDADLCGLDKVFFYAPGTRQAWRYVYDGQPPWVCGGTLCYTRERWRRAPFPHANVGEDNAFVWSAVPARMAVSPHCDLYVATVHPHNTSPKATAGRRWHAFPAAQLELLMRSGPLAAQAPASSSSA